MMEGQSKSQYIPIQKRGHNDLYCQTLRNEQIPPEARQQINCLVSNSQKQGVVDDEPKSNSHQQQLAKNLAEGVMSTHQPGDTTTGQKTYVCKQCDKSFNVKCNLTAHQRIHTGEKPFHCNHCDKNFTVASNLKAHQRTHTGEKPFICMQCDKSFAVSCNLKAHGRIHTGEKPYRCKQCGRSFNQSSPLQAHQRIHAREKRLSAANSATPV